MQLLARDDRGQLFENLLVMRVTVCPESFTGIAKGVPPELVAEMVRVAKVVQTVATAFASRQKMIYRALEVGMVGERQTTDPALWINCFEYFLLAGDGQGTLWLLCLVWACRQCFECLHPFSNSSGSSVAFPFNRCQV